MHDTLARLTLARCAPNVTVEIARNACGYHEFWRARELIGLGRKRAAQALANTPACAHRPASAHGVPDGPDPSGRRR